MTRNQRWLERFAHWTSDRAGNSWAFVLALSAVCIWLVTGPIFRFSNTWQLVINTGTTIVTFLMVFLIQRAQNKESRAMELKLNEIVAAIRGASNRLINVEDLDEENIELLHRRYQELADRTANEWPPANSHTVEEAKERVPQQHGAES